MFSRSSLIGASCEGMAIAHYSRIGRVVSIPIGNPSYDLIVDDGERRLRVQCKFSSEMKLYGKKTVSVKRRRADGSRETISGFDVLFCATPDGSMYEIPIECVEGRSSITLSQKFLIPAPAIKAKDPQPGDGRCGRCGKRHESEFAVCDKCRATVAKYQRRYRMRKRLKKSGRRNPQ
jgi:hypothetical protein